MKTETFKRRAIPPLYAGVNPAPVDSFFCVWLDKWFPWLLAVGITINLTGLAVPILEPDGALYAMISKTIAQTGDFVNLMVEGKDWLDKPHFPFWVTALSYKIFGINTFAYKLPALIFSAAGGYYTFLLARSLYSKQVAMLSVLIYLTAAHAVISNNDVRAEPYLTGLVTGSVYQFYMARNRTISFHLVLGSVLSAMAVMTKGPFLLVVIGSGFVVQFIRDGDYRQFAHYRWYVAMLLIILFISPELYCLYSQFDQHPEKSVFGQTGISGIRFFFWDSQFGRFMNTGPIRGKGDFFFYLHTLLWAFLPWSLMLYAAIYDRLINKIRGTTRQGGILVYSTAALSILLFSLSRFQLPHYTNIIFPFLAIITANYILALSRRRTIFFWTSVGYVLSVFIIGGMAFVIFMLDTPYKNIIVTAMLGAMVLITVKRSPHSLRDNFLRLHTSACIVYLALNLVVYPTILQYQSGLQAARYVNSKFPGYRVFTFLENSYSFAFYLDAPVTYHTSTSTLLPFEPRRPTILFTKETDLHLLKKAHISFRVLQTFSHFHVSQLTGRFINANTRTNALTKMVLVELEAPRRLITAST